VVVVALVMARLMEASLSKFTLVVHSGPAEKWAFFGGRDVICGSLESRDTNRRLQQVLTFVE
jgi:hypothetical protein